VVGFRGGSATATNVDFVVGIGKTTGVNAYKFNVDAAAASATSTWCLPDHDADLRRHGQRLPCRAVASTAAKAGVLNLVEG
jgi:hypothetical protein